MTVINHNYRYIYLHEPYTGGRATEEALMQHEGAFNCNGNHHIPVGKMFKRGFVTFTQFGDYIRFRTLRHPIDWLVTAWCLENKQRTPFMRWFRERRNALVLNGTVFWRYQYKANYTLYLENLQEGLDDAFDAMGIPRVVLPVKGQTENKPAWEDFLSFDDIEELHDAVPDLKHVRRYANP